MARRGFDDVAGACAVSYLCSVAVGKFQSKADEGPR